MIRSSPWVRFRRRERAATWLIGRAGVSSMKSGQASSSFAASTKRRNYFSSMSPWRILWLEISDASARIRPASCSALISRLKNDLDTLYRSPTPRDLKLTRKKELFATATIAARELFSVDTITLSSNARVVASETYKAQLVQLARLQEKTGGHPRKLLEALRTARDRGHGELEKLLEAGSI